MREIYVRWMDRLQTLCFFWCGLSLVAMAVLIFTGVVMRYGFGVGARFAEPMSIFFSVQLAMYGAAACYRVSAHLRLAFFVDLMPGRIVPIVDFFVQLLLGAVAIAMVWYGFSLAQTTWFQSYPEFTAIRVGVVYAAIPISGAIFLLFVIEHLLFGKQGIDYEEEELREAIKQAERAEQEAST